MSIGECNPGSSIPDGFPIQLSWRHGGFTDESQPTVGFGGSVACPGGYLAS